MEEQVQAALEGAAPEVVAEPQQDVTEAQAGEAEEGQPQSETAKRRERRERQIAALRESEAEATRRMAEAEARLQKVQQAAQSLKEPREADFDKYEDYVAAKTAWVSVKTLDERAAKDVEADLAERRKEVEAINAQKNAEARENWAAHVADAKARYSDFEAVVYNPSIPVTDRVYSAVLQTEAPADVAYQIASDPTLARSLSGMTDLELGRALGQIEARLNRPQPRIETRAPEPMSPVKPKGTATPDPDRMTMAEYKAWRQGR